MPDVHAGDDTGPRDDTRLRDDVCPRNGTGPRHGTPSPDGTAPSAREDTASREDAPALAGTVENPCRAGTAADARPWEPEALLHADPWPLLARLDLADRPEAGPEARLAAAVYRTSFDAHAPHPGERRWLLGLDAARWGAVGLLAALTDTPAREPPSWRPVWATGARTDERLRLSWLESVQDGATVHAVIPVGDRTAVVTTGRDRGWLRDLETGERIGRTLTLPGRPPGLTSVAVAEVGGRPVVVADGRDPGGSLPTVEVWDAATGEHFGSILTGHAGGVAAVATATVNGRATVVSTGWEGDVEIRDLLTGDMTLPPLLDADAVSVETAALDGHPVTFGGFAEFGWSPLVTFGGVAPPGGSRPAGDGRTVPPGGDPVVVTTGRSGERRIWWLRADRPPSPANGPAPPPAWSGAAVVTDGEAVVPRDLRSGAPVGPPLPFAHVPWGLARATLRGRQVLVTGAPDGRVRVWDLQAREAYEPPCEPWPDDPGEFPEPLGRPLPGHAAEVCELTVVTGGGRTTVVSRDEEGGTLTRDALTGQPAGPVDPVDENRAVRVERAEGNRVTLHDPRTGQALGPPLGPFAGIPAVSVTELDGVPVVFTGDRAGSVDLWVLRTGERLPRPERPASTVNVVETVFLDGRPVAVTGSTGGPSRVWDLRDRRRLDPPLDTREVYALAATELDGRALVATGGYALPYGEVRLFDLRTREPVGPPARFPEPVRALAWTPGGLLLVAFGPEVAAVRPPLPRARP
ncbi:hypothetical protein GCM10010517_21060 [Streptosporangium fragile]|uniref:WD40 repeat domain-containing protein n=1 Tax=Streptosporangium fragile TaxID=46186 RepID=A0ABP6IAD2_9ACTN